MRAGSWRRHDRPARWHASRGHAKAGHASRGHAEACGHAPRKAFGQVHTDLCRRAVVLLEDMDLCWRQAGGGNVRRVLAGGSVRNQALGGARC